MTKKGFEQIMRAAGAAAGKMRRTHKESLSPTLITISLDPMVTAGAGKASGADASGAGRARRLFRYCTRSPCCCAVRPSLKQLS